MLKNQRKSTSILTFFCIFMLLFSCKETTSAVQVGEFVEDTKPVEGIKIDNEKSWKETFSNLVIDYENSEDLTTTETWINLSADKGYVYTKHLAEPREILSTESFSQITGDVNSNDSANNSASKIYIDTYTVVTPLWQAEYTEEVKRDNKLQKASIHYNNSGVLCNVSTESYSNNILSFEYKKQIDAEFNGFWDFNNFLSDLKDSFSLLEHDDNDNGYSIDVYVKGYMESFSLTRNDVLKYDEKLRLTVYIEKENGVNLVKELKFTNPYTINEDNGREVYYSSHFNKNLNLSTRITYFSSEYTLPFAIPIKNASEIN